MTQMLLPVAKFSYLNTVTAPTAGQKLKQLTLLSIQFMTLRLHQTLEEAITFWGLLAKMLGL